MLGCNPKSLLRAGQGDWQPQEGERRESAAKLARDQYAEAISGKAWQTTVQSDLLDLDAPSPSYSSTSASRSVTERADNPGGLWPGDSVFARYGPGGEFYHARVVRVYSSRGLSLADIEWLRPQAGSRSDTHFLCSRGFDDTMHRNGLQVGSDVCRQSTPPSAASAGQSASLQAMVPPLPQSSVPLPVLPAPHRLAPPTTVAGSSGGDLLDLLDLQSPSEDLLASNAPLESSTTAIGQGMPFIQPLSPQASNLAVPMNSSSLNIVPPVSALGGSSMVTVQQAMWSTANAPQVASGSPMASSYTSWAAPPPAVMQPHLTLRPQDNFDFVSDMMLQASDSTGKTPP